MTYGEVLDKLEQKIREYGLSTKAAAEVIGCNAHHLWRIRNGICKPYIDTFYKMLDFCDLEVDEKDA